MDSFWEQQRRESIRASARRICEGHTKRIGAESYAQVYADGYYPTPSSVIHAYVIPASINRNFTCFVPIDTGLEQKVIDGLATFAYAKNYDRIIALKHETDPSYKMEDDEFYANLARLYPRQ